MILSRRRRPYDEFRHLRHLLFSTAGPPPPEIPRVYEAATAEKNALDKWRSAGTRRKTLGGVKRPVFRMLLPPPNVTGKLHLGHFLTVAVEDTIARWKLMTGLDVEWIPGFDHAGIATQNLVNRRMAKQSVEGGTAVASNLMDFASSNLGSIRQQLEASGALLDWSSEYYTLDEKHSAVVQEAFIQLFESGLIKRADGLINWSCALQTTVADIEVDNTPFVGKTSIRVPNHDTEVEFGVLYYVTYKLADSDDQMVVATSRPETMFGDVALAVNPVDSRYASFIGRQVVNPLNGNLIPVIADDRVKLDFGTGVVKVTPAHDKLDFAIGSSKNLESVTIFTEEGKLNEKCGEYQGLWRFAARRKVIEQLIQMKVLMESKDYSGSIGVCTRSGDIIEPRLVPHWFLQTQFLSSKLIQAIEDKSFLIVPDGHSRSLVHQLKELKDWCLSRQIQWGHRIPAFYHADHPDQWVVAKTIEEAVLKLEKLLQLTISDTTKVIQDPDVLDTWFSSSLIPLSVSDWPNSDEFKEITLMETGHDILLFWVWRMAIMSLALVNRFPFRHVLLHGIVTDHYGRKMSKSKGNVIDPLHIINGISYEDMVKEAENAFASGDLDEKELSLRKVALKENHSDGFPVCGTDALRLTLLSQDISDIEVTLELIHLDNCRRFTNKLWQALRFFKMHTTVQTNALSKTDTQGITKEVDDLGCKWLLACLYEFNATSEAALNQAKFHLYAKAVRTFFYQELCDVYIELIKADMKADLPVTKAISIMQYAFETGMRLAHPIIPFLTEEIWSYLKNDTTTTLLHEDFPKSKDLEQFRDPNLISAMSKAMQITREIRGQKARNGYGSKVIPEVFIEVDKVSEGQLANLINCISKLSRANVTFGKYPPPEKGLYGTTVLDLEGNISKVHMPLTSQAAKSTSQAKIEKLKVKLLKLQQQLEHPSFQQNAPPAAKEKLQKRVETLILQINENCNNPNQQDQPPTS